MPAEIIGGTLLETTKGISRVMWLLQCALAAALAAGADAPPELDSILRGVAVGTTLEAFLEARPDAVTRSDPESGDVTVTEHLTRDPLMGMECWTNFGFRAGRLREFIISWGGPLNQASLVRDAFFELLIDRHGREFRREVQLIKPKSDAPERIPALYWREHGHHVFAAYAVTRNRANETVSTFTYAMFPLEDGFIEEQLIARGLSSAELREVFGTLWEALDRILAESP